MSKPEAEGYVSVIGTAFIQPVLDLIERLESEAPVLPNEVKTGQRENGYSLAIITLGTILLESALHRMAYVRGDNDTGPMADYFKGLTSNGQLGAEVEEIFAVRNVIVHNHLWEAKITSEDNSGMRFTEPPVLCDGYGDNRHKRVMNPATRKSQILGINMFPSRIWRRDAYIAIKVIAKGLNELESTDRRYFYLSPRHFRFQKKTVTFKEVMESLLIPQDV
jgi:hypothetical protein